MRDRAWSAEPQSAWNLIFEDLDQPVEDGQPLPCTRGIRVAPDIRPVRRVAARKPPFQLADCLRISGAARECS